MRTYIELDENLINKVVEMSHFPSKKAVIHASLTEFVKAQKRKQLLALRGKVKWEGDLDQLRATRNTVND